MSSQPEERRESPEPVGPETPAPDEAGSGKLSTTTITNISLISVVGFISILLLMFGNFDGKISRVVSTLLLFAVFTFVSSNDLRRIRSAAMLRFSQLSNVYMLVLSLVLIWGSLAVQRYEDGTLLPLTFFIAVLVKVTALSVERVMLLAGAKQRPLVLSARLTAGGLVLVGVLFTLPMGLYRMVTFGDFYWRFAVAVILFTALALSVSLLILWAGKRDAAAVQRSPLPAPISPVPSLARNTSFDRPAGTVSQPPMAPPVPAAPAQSAVTPPQFATPQAASLPWPVFPDGRPLPAKTNGRPDFSALAVLASQYERAERQFFG